MVWKKAAWAFIIVLYILAGLVGLANLTNCHASLKTKTHSRKMATLSVYRSAFVLQFSSHFLLIRPMSVSSLLTWLTWDDVLAKMKRRDNQFSSKKFVTTPSGGKAKNEWILKMVYSHHFPSFFFPSPLIFASASSLLLFVKHELLFALLKRLIWPLALHGGQSAVAWALKATFHHDSYEWQPWPGEPKPLYATRLSAEKSIYLFNA